MKDQCYEDTYAKFLCEDVVRNFLIGKSKENRRIFREHVSIDYFKYLNIYAALQLMVLLLAVVT